MPRKSGLSQLPKTGREFVERELARPDAQEDISEWLQRDWDENITLAEKCRDKDPDTFRSPWRMCYYNIAKIVPEEDVLTTFAVYWMGYEQHRELLHSRVARRWGLEDPAELGAGLFVLGRLELFVSALQRLAATSTDLLQASEFLRADISPVFSEAVSDFAAADLMRRYLGDRQVFDYHYGLDEIIHDADVALWHGDMNSVIRLCDSVTDLKNVPKFYQAVIRWYRSVAAGDAADAAASLQDSMKAWARIQKKSDVEFALQEWTTARYRIAERISPELVRDFDTAQKFPWDAGLFEWVNEHREQDHVLDTSSLSPMLHALISDLKLPDWLPVPITAD